MYFKNVVNYSLHIFSYYIYSGFNTMTYYSKHCALINEENVSSMLR